MEVIASDFSYLRGVFFLRDVHPVMRHVVAKEEFDGFQGSLVVLSPVYTQPLEIRRHQQLTPALKRSPNTRTQGRLAHQHLTDFIGPDADSFHLGDSLAWEGIHINTISPGDFPSDLNTTAREHTDEMKKVIPGKRIGEMENIAGAAIFLASDASNFVNGQIIFVDGGMTACV